MNPKTIVIGIFGVLALVVSLVLGLAVTDHLDSNSTPVVVSLVAIAAAAIPGLLALLSSERTRYDLNNGVVPRKVKEALEQFNVDNPAISGASAEEVQAIVDNREAPKGEDPSGYQARH